MIIGRLRHRVTFQRSTPAVNAVGDPVDVWANITTTWARIEPLAGKERFAALQQQADADYRILCRYQSALSALRPEDRAMYDGQVFDIKSVINTDFRNIELQIFARHNFEVVEAGEIPANALYDADGNPLTFVDGEYIETVD